MMWEAASPEPPRGDAAPPKQPPRAGGDFVLWAQILLCAAALALVFCARAVWPGVYTQLRVAWTAALSLREDDLLGEERRFTRFAQQALAALGQSAQEVLAELRGEAEPAAVSGQTAEAPRVAHTKNAPSGCREESYRPDFALTAPLPAATWATSGYGWRTNPVKGKGDEFHTGADLHADEGTPVLAAADGVVRAAGTGVTYGNYLRILHQNGDETLYAHMQYLFVRAGQSVRAGETLGTVGHTGNVTGPHLHFELLHEGWRYDPTAVLQAAGAFLSAE